MSGWTVFFMYFNWARCTLLITELDFTVLLTEMAYAAFPTEDGYSLDQTERIYTHWTSFYCTYYWSMCTELANSVDMTLFTSDWTGFFPLYFGLIYMVLFNVLGYIALMMFYFWLISYKMNWDKTMLYCSSNWTEYRNMCILCSIFYSQRFP